MWILNAQKSNPNDVESMAMHAVPTTDFSRSRVVQQIRCPKGTSPMRREKKTISASVAEIEVV